MAAICPHCRAAVTSLDVDPAVASMPDQVAQAAKIGADAEAPALDAVIFSCPACHKVLGCQFDTADLADTIINELRRR